MWKSVVFRIVMLILAICGGRVRSQGSEQVLVTVKYERGSYLGCFKEVGNSSNAYGDNTSFGPIPLSPSSPSDPQRTISPGSGHTVEQCIADCTQQFYRFASLKKGHVCLCGGEFDSRWPGTCEDKCKGNSSQICGGKAAISAYATGLSAPGPPPYLRLLNASQTTLAVEWSTPRAANGVLLGYRVVAQLLFPTKDINRRSINGRLEWQFPNTTLKADLVGVRPGSKYNVSVAAVGVTGEAGIAISHSFWTELGDPVKPFPPTVIKRDPTSMIVRIRPSTQTSVSNSPVSSYRVVVVDESEPSYFSTDQLRSWSESQNAELSYYIAAELSPRDINDDFVVGDGGTYGGYYNPPLPVGHDIHVTIGVTSTLNGKTKTSYAPVTHEQHKGPGSVLMVSHMDGEARLGSGRRRGVNSGSSGGSDYDDSSDESDLLVQTLSVSIGVFGSLLVLAVALYIGLRYRGSQLKKRRRTSEQQELSLQGAVVDVEENGYLHAGYDAGSDECSSPRDNHLSRLKDQVWEVPRGMLSVSQTDILGRGKYGQVSKAIVQKRGVPITVAAHCIADRSQSGEERRKMLIDLGQLIGVGHHSNVVELIGTCEDNETLYVLLEYHPATLKDVLLESRVLENCPQLASSNRLSTLDERSLLEFAVGIARGMEKLHQKKIVHKQLCARNVLMLDGIIPKITGFAIASCHRNGQQCDYSRWTAVEVFQSGYHAPKCDIWSFGVLLWELVTLGATPYAAVPTRDLAARLQRGVRPSRPDGDVVGDDLFQLVLQCWQLDLDERPSFAELAEVLRGMQPDASTHLNMDATSGQPATYEPYLPELEFN